MNDNGAPVDTYKNTMKLKDMAPWDTVLYWNAIEDYKYFTRRKREAVRHGRYRHRSIHQGTS